MKPIVGGKLSSVTLAHVHANIRAILNFAVKKKRFLRNNVSEEIISPPSIKSKERECYGLEEIKEIRKLASNENLRFMAIVEVALSGSLRRGEIAGLNWKDIDIHNNTIKISRSATVISGVGIHLGEPKTSASNATVSVSSDTIKSLLKYKEELECIGFIIDEDSPVFISQNGNRLSPNKISCYWKAFIDKTNLPKHSFHSLRHSSLSLLYSLTQNIVQVSKHARHSKVSTTADIYLHANTTSEKDMLDKYQLALK